MQISQALPKTKDVKKVKHFAACPYPALNDSLEQIKKSGASERVKLAIEFLILTAARSNEARGARWEEIDFAGQRWIIPKERMKSGREHRVPLSARALEIPESLKGSEEENELIFFSDKGKQFSDMTFTMLLRRLGYDFTIHGLRSTFRDWGGRSKPPSLVRYAKQHWPIQQKTRQRRPTSAVICLKSADNY